MTTQVCSNVCIFFGNLCRIVHADKAGHNVSLAMKDYLLEIWKGFFRTSNMFHWGVTPQSLPECMAAGRVPLTYALRPALLQGCSELDACSLMGTQDTLHLAGYGVEMAIKNMEYSALDDSQVDFLQTWVAHNLNLSLRFGFTHVLKFWQSCLTLGSPGLVWKLISMLSRCDLLPENQVVLSSHAVPCFSGPEACCSCMCS